MTPAEKPFLLRHPIKNMIVAALVLAVLGILLTFTVVGAIVGLPMMGLAIVFGVAAWWKMRNINVHHHHTHS